MSHHPRYVLLLVLALASCSKKADPSKPTIPTNSIQLSDNGQVVVFATATAEIATNGLGQKQLTIEATTTDQNHQVSLFGADRQGVEVPRSYSGTAAGSAYTVSLTNYSTVCRPVNTNTQLYQFYTGTTTTPDFRLDVQAVDATTHTISGTFSGTYTLGCDSRTITQGKFNLPYTVRP